MMIYLSFFIPSFLIMSYLCLLKFVDRNKYGVILLCVFCFIVEANFRVGRDGIENSGIDLQMLVKATVWGICLVISMFWLVMRLELFSIILKQKETKLFALWIAISLISSVFSNYPLYAMFYTVLLAVFYIVALSVVVSINENGDIEHSLLFFLVSYVLIGIAVYTIYPQLGSVEYWANGKIAGTRFTGMSASANGLGRMIAILIILIVVMYFNNKISMKSFIFLLAFSLFFILLTWSRSAIVLSLVSCVCVYYLKNLKYYFNFILILLSLFLFLSITSAYFIVDILSLFSRTGNVEEILTLTGRTDIWFAVMDAFFEKPLLGWGYGVSKFELPGLFESEWGWVTGSAHNLFLQSLFSNGLLGFVAFFLFLLRGLYLSYIRKDLFFLAINIYVLLSGLTEASAFGPTPNFLTFIWFLLFARSSYEKGTTYTST